MSYLFLYLLKLSLGLAGAYIFYQVFLRRLTFYNWNRWYLLLYPLFSFVVAAIDIAPWLANAGSRVSAVDRLPALPLSDAFSVMSRKTTSLESGGWSPEWILLWVLGLGALFMLLRLTVACWSLHRLRRSSVAVEAEGIKFFLTEKNIVPFAFGKAIFLNKSAHGEAELLQIVRHEFVHVRQHHFIDLWAAELICVLNWFNPFAWLIRKAIRQNLEFIADREVLKEGFDRKQYQYLLLKVLGNTHFSIASSFNYSSLKKRIAMMNKNRSVKLHLIRFLFLLPLLAVLLLAFRRHAGPDGRGPHAADIVANDTVPRGHASIGLAADGTRSAEELDFLKRHPRVDRLVWGLVTDANQEGTGALPIFQKGDLFLIIYFRNGKTDTYNVSQPAGRERFRKNYGEEPPAASPGAGTAAIEPATGGTLKRSLDPSLRAVVDTLVYRVDFSAGQSFRAVADTVVHRLDFSADPPFRAVVDTVVHRVDFSADPPFRAVADTVVHRVDFSADRLYVDTESGMIALAGNARIYDRQNGVIVASDSIRYYYPDRK